MRASITKSTKMISLEDVQVVYTDSKEALEQAYAKGLSRAAELRSTSPALIADSELNVQQADANLSHAKIKQLENILALIGRDCQGLFGDNDYDLIASRYVTLEFQAIAGKAALLSDEDFTRPLAVVTLSSGDSYLNSIIC